MAKELLEKVTIWYSIKDAGDGSAYLIYFLNEEDAITYQENSEEGWGEFCYGFVGSKTYNQAS